MSDHPIPRPTPPGHRPAQPGADLASPANPATAAPVGPTGPTGDARVDAAIAALPDPDRLLPTEQPDPDSTDQQTVRIGSEGQDDSGSPVGGTGADGDDGADPTGETLDDQVAAVTDVHRRLQQRLSDLSG